VSSELLIESTEQNGERFEGKRDEARFWNRFLFPTITFEFTTSLACSLKLVGPTSTCPATRKLVNPLLPLDPLLPLLFGIPLSNHIDTLQQRREFYYYDILQQTGSNRRTIFRGLDCKLRRGKSDQTSSRLYDTGVKINVHNQGRRRY